MKKLVLSPVLKIIIIWIQNFRTRSVDFTYILLPMYLLCFLPIFLFFFLTLEVKWYGSQNVWNGQNDERC